MMNEKWFSLSISDIEKKLKTNAASGLSPKAARSRYKKRGSSFYVKRKKSSMSLFGEIAADFALVLLVISSVVALCFTEYTTGVTLALILAVNLGICLALSYRAQRLFESMSVFFLPTTTVVRSGKAFSVDHEHVVVGDVVLLGEGDVISFDARLITSDNLKVVMKLDRELERECEKLAEGLVRENENDVSAMVNMVHAGSRVISGGARAVVTAVGRYTYYGAMTGGVELPELRDIPRGLRLLKKYCSSFGMLVTISLLPFCFLSLIFSKGNVTLLTSFTAALAIAASSMSQLATTACRIFFEKQAKRGLEGANKSITKSCEIMDTLVSLEYVFMLDGSAVSDGVLHFNKAICGDGELSGFNAISSSAKYFADLVSLYNSAESRTLTTGIHAPGRFRLALDEFTGKCGVDSEALKIRCSVSGYVPGDSGDKTDKLFFSDSGRRLVLNVSQKSEAIERCSRVYIGGSECVLSAEGREALSAEYKKYAKRGMITLVFTVSESEFGGNDIFAGILVLSERIDESFYNTLSTLKGMGIKTISFVGKRSGNPYERFELSSPTFGRAVSRKDFDTAEVPLSYKFGEIDTYRGFSPEEIGGFISMIHAEKKKVAVISFSDAYEKLPEKPDVVITCSALRYKMSGRFEEEIESVETAGASDSLCCRQDVKGGADLIIPRPDGKHGGLVSLKRAFFLAGAAYNNLAGFFRYVLCSQFIRIVCVMLPMLFGEAHLDARHALFCGFLLDLGVMAVFVNELCGIENAKGFRSISGEFRSPARNNAGMIISAVAGGLTVCFLPNIMGYVGVIGQYFYETEYMFFSMILLHITVMYCIRIDNARRFGRFSVNRAALWLVPSVLVFCVACFLVEPIGVFFNVLEISAPYLFLTAVPSAVTAILYFVIGDLRLVPEE
ncbi:MAG: hypothetical protein E7641_00590 [Ruminococcaceae bacterium]|nr:hypothetical protein [Oscillospiraceae bacterium]